MTPPVRSVLYTALALLGVGSVVALVQLDAHFALGVLLTGLATIASLLLGVVAMKNVGKSNTTSSRVLAVPFVLKLPLLLGAGWILLTRFPPLSVVLGATTLIASITVNAALGRLLPGVPGKA